MTAPGGCAVELVTFAVKAGKEARAEEWIRVLRDRRDECVATLDRERMHYEAIFTAYRQDRLFLSWFSVQGQGGATAASSPLPIDTVHRDFWDECIDREVPPETHAHALSLVPTEIGAAIAARDAALLARNG